MSGSYNLNSAQSSDIHFSHPVELDLADESRVYFAVRGIEGRYSMQISNISVAEFSVEIEDVEAGDKMLFLVYNDGRFEGRLETYPGIVERKDDTGLNIRTREEKILLFYHQLKGDLDRVKIGDIVYLRRRNEIYFQGYFRYYPQQTQFPKIIDKQLSATESKLADDQDSTPNSSQSDTQSKHIELQEPHTYKVPDHLQSIKITSPKAKESNMQELDSLKKSYLYPVSQTFIETLKHFFHSYRPMVVVEDSFYKAIITGYLESLCNSIYSSNILQDFITKLSEAQGFYAIDDKIQGLRDIVLSNLNYLLTLKSDTYIKNSDFEEIILDEGLIRPLTIYLRGLADKFLSQSRVFPKPGHIPLPFENIMKALSEILNINIVLIDINACTYSQYVSSRFNFILYYHYNNKSLDRFYLNYEHPFSSIQVSHSILDKYRCNLCNLLPHESVLSLEDTCYCSNCLGYLVSKGMLSCNICTKRHSFVTIRTIKQKAYICSGCLSEYNYQDFIGEIQCTHGLCKFCTEISKKRGVCKGCSRVLRPEEVQVIIKCELCGENKTADNFTVEKLCRCDICDDCVLEYRENTVKCGKCSKYLYDRNVEKCLKCGKIDSHENGMMPRCNHFLCKDCSKNSLRSDIDNLIFPPQCSICKDSLQASDYSHIEDPDQIQKYIQYNKKVKVQSGVTKSKCGICRVSYRIDSIRTLQCDHSFCDDCMITYILSWLDNTIRPLAVTCPQCPMEISPVIIQDVLPTTEFDIYSRTCFNASNSWCRKCMNAITLSNDNAYCTTCKVRLCKVCSQNYHEGKCDPITIKEIKSRTTHNKILLQCPNCKHEYLDSYMSYKAVCMKCLTKFCLKCYRLYNPIQVHGYHFHSSACRIYKPTCKPDQFNPDCIYCINKGSLCVNRATIINLDT
jgi:hypothetical protein